MRLVHPFKLNICVPTGLFIFRRPHFPQIFQFRIRGNQTPSAWGKESVFPFEWNMKNDSVRLKSFEIHPVSNHFPNPKAAALASDFLLIHFNQRPFLPRSEDGFTLPWSEPCALDGRLWSRKLPEEDWFLPDPNQHPFLPWSWFRGGCFSFSSEDFHRPREIREESF